MGNNESMEILAEMQCETRSVLQIEALDNGIEGINTRARIEDLIDELEWEGGADSYSLDDLLAILRRLLA